MDSPLSTKMKELMISATYAPLRRRSLDTRTYVARRHRHRLLFLYLARIFCKHVIPPLFFQNEQTFRMKIEFKKFTSLRCIQA